MLYLICACGLVFIIYSFLKWFNNNSNFFKIHNIKVVPGVPLLGNTMKMMLKKLSPQEFVSEVYNFEPQEKIVGIFDMKTPIIVLRDLDIIKKIVIKDFDHFTDHRFILEPENDTLLGNSLFIMQGNKWRDMRATLSPAFTSSKMRQMFEFVVECATDTANYYDKQLQIDGNRELLEVKESFSRFTNDVIATCAFGIKVNSLENKDNDIYKIGRTFSGSFSSAGRIARILLLRLLPIMLTKTLGIEFFEKHVKNFFKNIVMDTIRQRELQNIFRPDMINILLQIRKGTLNKENQKSVTEETGFATVQEDDHISSSSVKTKWNDDELVGQAFIFFLAGFDTTSTSLQFMAYEITVNPDVQKRLQKEIDEMEIVLNGKPLSYDDLHKLKYLDMVISEVLRKWSPVPATDRMCVKDYIFDDGQYKFNIKKGQGAMWVPIWGFHHDPKYFPNPDKFDPERFNDENKHKIIPGTYLPFGLGPRNCIGSRFALMEIKAILYYMLRKFNFEACEKSVIPVKLARSPFGIFLEKPFIMELKLRK